MANNKDKCKGDYFLDKPERNADMKTSAEITESIHNEFKEVFTGTE